MQFCKLGIILDGELFKASFEGRTMKQVALACISLCAAIATAQPKWTDAEVWRLKLQPYMTVRQVQSLLGDPVDREVSKIAQIWYYEKGPVREGGRVIERPTTGIVRFNLTKTNPFTKQRLPQPVFVVTDFAEPDSPIVPVNLFETRAEPLRKKQQDAALERQQALEWRQQEIARRREELAIQQQERREAARKQQELSGKRRQELQTRMEGKKAPETKEPKDYSPLYFFTVGGFFIGVATMIAVFKKDSV